MASSMEDTTTTTASIPISETLSDDDRPKRRVIQNFLLIWVDSFVDESAINYEDAITQLQPIINTILTYTDTSLCVDFIQKVEKEFVFLIVSSSLSEQLIPFIHDLSQVEAIYILGDETMVSTKWTKVKGVYSQITSMYEILKENITQCNRNHISMSFIPSNDDRMNPNLKQLDPSFMYTQIFKEILLENKYDENSIDNLVVYCKKQYEANLSVLKIIDEFKRDYPRKSSIWWYTRPCFIYEMLNRALRNLEVDTVIAMGFFIENLHRHIDRLYKEQNIGTIRQPLIVYRGQGLSELDFKKLMKTKGGLISFNNFLSTSIQRDVSFMFAESNSMNRNTIGVLFKITVNPMTFSSSFARIDDISYCSDEGEVLFSMHTVFRIGEIKRTEDNPNVWQVDLEISSEGDEQLNALTSKIREETAGSTSYERLSKLLTTIGQFQKAEELYQTLLEQTWDKHKKSIFYLQLGDIKDSRGAYKEAIFYYEKSLEIKEEILFGDNQELGMTYIYIATAYMKNEDHAKARRLQKMGMEILQRNIFFNHPDLIISYIDTGAVYQQTDEDLKALLLQEDALENSQKILPSNHPHLAASYNNIGIVYHNIGEYSKALSYYEKALEIFKKTVPPNHPSLASLYNNIGSLYKNLDEYSKALEYHEKSLEIRQRSLPANHPDLATSYNNVACVYENMGEYSKTLEYHEKSLEIKKKTLPVNHPDLATSYNNIGGVYYNMGEYLKALEYHEKSLEIRQKTLLANHPELSISYVNIAMVYSHIGEHSKAFECYEKSLAIRQIILSANRSDLATFYSNLGTVYQSKSEYSKALKYHEKSLEIRQKTLPANHPDLATSYNNIAMIYIQMGEFFKALSFLKSAEDIFEQTLYSKHPEYQAVQMNIEFVSNQLCLMTNECK